jgi:Transglutaminase elicitor
MSTFVVALTAFAALGAPISSTDVAKQNKTFEQLWETGFEWRYDQLPEKGGVDEWRVPYSGYIYPDTAGGTASSLRKYDRAFNGGRGLATSYEKRDTSMTERQPGLFGGRLFSRERTPDWYGHCNGWTSAAIRHAEPVNSVTRNGVTFSPSDIKGLLAEIYIYNHHEVLAGENQRPINAGVFHAIVSNWVGRGDHPLGMEADPSEEKWNYPIYAFATSSAKHSDREIEVKMNIAYAKDSNGEWDESPRIKRVKYFHYMLNLDVTGKIVGGHFYRDSNVIDMLWVPLRPKQAGRPGNESGNPYVNVDQVLAIWRDSAPKETRKKWLTVDPAELDRVAITTNEETTPVSESTSSVDTDEASDDLPVDSNDAEATSSELVSDEEVQSTEEPSSVEALIDEPVNEDELD